MFEGAFPEVNRLEASQETLEKRDGVMQIRAELIGFENADKEQEINWMLAFYDHH